MPDLFAVAPPRPAPVFIFAASNVAAKMNTLAACLPRRATIAWERRLALAGDLPIELHVSKFWTGIVVEVLSLADARAFLHSDGSVRDVLPPDIRCYHAVFVTPAEARRIARTVPLAALGSPGTVSCRLAAAATPADAWPALDEWLDRIEAAGAADA